MIPTIFTIETAVYANAQFYRPFDHALATVYTTPFPFCLSSRISILDPVNSTANEHYVKTVSKYVMTRRIGL